MIFICKGDFMSYKNEVKEKYGNTNEYKEYAEKTKDYSNDKFENLSKEMDLIFKEFSILLLNQIKANSAEALELVKKLQSFITNNYYNCSNDILYGLGQMYVMDERFKNNIDKHSDGTANYVYNAIKNYCNK